MDDRVVALRSALFGAGWVPPPKSWPVDVETSLVRALAAADAVTGSDVEAVCRAWWPNHWPDVPNVADERERARQALAAATAAVDDRYLTIKTAIELARRDRFDAIKTSERAIDAAQQRAINDYIDALRARLRSSDG